MNDSSARYHAAADALWGPRHGEPPSRRRDKRDPPLGEAASRRFESPRQVGKGRVFPNRAAARACLTPDVTFNGPSLDWIHRTCADGTDIYFLSNQKGETVTTTATFRQPEGRVVELWDAVTGERAAAGSDPRVEVELPAYGSRFVVFRSQQAATLPHGEPPSWRRSRGSATLPWEKRRLAASDTTLPSTWDVTFDLAWGGPEKPLTFDTLVDWTARPEPGIRHYSGTATYRQNLQINNWRAIPCTDGVKRKNFFDRNARYVLNLGDVMVMAEVYVNGKYCGTAWHAPYKVDVTGALREGDENDVVVKVTNTWRNRVLYDLNQPEEKRKTWILYRKNFNPSPDSPPIPSGLLGPVRLLRRPFVSVHTD
jgi:hypothetical protein